MNKKIGSIELLEEDRQRLVSIATAGALALSLLFGLFLHSAISWMFSSERYALNTSEKVELVSSGLLLEGESLFDKMLLADDEDGNPVVVDRYDDAKEIPKGQTFSAWYAPEGTSLTLSGAPGYTSGAQGYYSFKEYLPQLKNHNDAWVVIGFSLISTLFLTAFSFAFSVIYLAKKSEFSRGINFPSIKTMLRSSDYGMPKGVLRATSRLALGALGVQTIAVLVALLAWGTAPGESSQDYSLITLTFVGYLLSGMLIAVLGLDLADTSAIYVFSRFGIRDLGRFSAEILKPNIGDEATTDAPPWIYRWLENDGWHEDTARVLLDEFDGTLKEISTISRELGPDPEYSAQKTKSLKKLSKV